MTDRYFGILFWGKTVSTMATWAFTILIVTAAYNLTSSATWVGLVGAAQMVPQLFLSLVSGRFADARGERLPIITGGLLQGAMCFALLGWWLLLGDDDPPGGVRALLICSFVSGCGLSLCTTAMHSVVRRIVDPQDISTAVALNMLPMALSRTLGPAAGAALLVVVDRDWSLVVIGATFVIAALGFTRLPAGARADRDDDADLRIRAVFQYIWQDRVLLVYLLGVAVMGIGAEPIITLAPTLAASLGDPRVAGWIVASFGVGGMLGVVVHRCVSSWVRPSTEALAATAILAFLLIPSALAPALSFLVVVVAAGGCNMVMATTGFGVAVQQRADPSFNGRVMAVWVIAFAGVRPLAAVAVGSAADRWTVRVAFIGTAVVVVLAAAALSLILRASYRGESVD